MVNTTAANALLVWSMGRVVQKRKALPRVFASIAQAVKLDEQFGRRVALLKGARYDHKTRNILR